MFKCAVCATFLWSASQRAAEDGALAGLTTKGQGYLADCSSSMQLWLIFVEDLVVFVVVVVAVADVDVCRGAVDVVDWVVVLAIGWAIISNCAGVLAVDCVTALIFWLNRLNSVVVGPLCNGGNELGRTSASTAGRFKHIQRNLSHSEHKSFSNYKNKTNGCGWDKYK